MTVALGVCGCAALFVVFGLVGGGHEKHEQKDHCDTCGIKENTATCGDCLSVSEISEQSHE